MCVIKTAVFLSNGVEWYHPILSVMFRPIISGILQLQTERRGTFPTNGSGTIRRVCVILGFVVNENEAWALYGGMHFIGLHALLWLDIQWEVGGQGNS